MNAAENKLLAKYILGLSEEEIGKYIRSRLDDKHSLIDIAGYQRKTVSEEHKKHISLAQKARYARARA